MKSQVTFSLFATTFGLSYWPNDRIGFFWHFWFRLLTETRSSLNLLIQSVLSFVRWWLLCNKNAKPTSKNMNSQGICSKNVVALKINTANRLIA